MFEAWLRAFLFTQIVEVPIYVRGLRCSRLAAFGASALTHPVVWLVFFGRFWRADYTTRFASAELFAWLVEAAYFRFLLGKRGALLWSFVANAASVLLGLACRRLFGFP
jgi:hypothetical protein